MIINYNYTNNDSMNTYDAIDNNVNEAGYKKRKLFGDILI